MVDQPWTDEHSRLVHEARPVAGVAVDDLDEIWARVISTLERPRARRRRRRLTPIVGAGVAAVLVGAGGVAAANVFSAHTGEYNHGWEERAGGPGEVLDPAAPDYGGVVHQLVADIPFPSQQARDLSWQTQKRETSGPRNAGSKVSAGALRGFTADDAICSWADAWAAAVETGDHTAKARATGALDGAATWPAVAALDPSQVPSTTVPVVGNFGASVVGTRVVSDDRFAYLTLVRAAAHGADPAQLGAALAYNVRCIPGLVPHLPQALPDFG